MNARLLVFLALFTSLSLALNITVEEYQGGFKNQADWTISKTSILNIEGQYSGAHFYYANSTTPLSISTTLGADSLTANVRKGQYNDFHLHIILSERRFKQQYCFTENEVDTCTNRNMIEYELKQVDKEFNTAKNGKQYILEVVTKPQSVGNFSFAGHDPDFNYVPILLNASTYYSLISDVSCPAGATNCITIAGNDVTLDCQYHKIYIGNDTGSIAVFGSGVDRVNITNCTFIQTNVTNAIAIENYQGSDDWLIQNNNLSMVGSGSAIYSYAPSTVNNNLSVLNNIFYGTGTGTAIALRLTNNVTISNNNIGVAQGSGISTAVSYANNVYVANNTVEKNGTNNYGLYVAYGWNWLITNMSINSASPAIVLGATAVQAAQNISLENSTINAFDTYGFFIKNTGNFTTKNVSVNTWGTSSSGMYPIYATKNVSDVNIFNSTLQSNNTFVFAGTISTTGATNTGNTSLVISNTTFIKGTGFKNAKNSLDAFCNFNCSLLFRNITGLDKTQLNISNISITGWNFNLDKNNVTWSELVYVNVTNAGLPIVGVAVNITNMTGTSTGTTGANGLTTDVLRVREFSANGSFTYSGTNETNATFYQPVTVSVCKTGYSCNSTTIGLNYSQVFNISMDLSGAAYSDYTNISFYSPVNQSSLNQTFVNITCGFSSSLQPVNVSLWVNSTGASYTYYNKVENIATNTSYTWNLSTLSNANYSWYCNLTNYTGYVNTTKGYRWFEINKSSAAVYNPENATITAYSDHVSNHSFNITAYVMHNRGGTDIMQTYISFTGTGVCMKVKNYTSGNYFYANYTCNTTIQGMLTNINISFNDTQPVTNWTAALGSHAFPDHTYTLNAPAITPDPASITDTLTCLPGTVSDVDGDSENTTERAWRWFKNNTVIGGATTNTLTPVNFGATDMINCEEYSVAINWTTSNNTKNSTQVNITIFPHAPENVTITGFVDDATSHAFVVNGYCDDNSTGNDIYYAFLNLSAGTCSQVSNSTAGTRFNVVFSCSHTVPATPQINLNCVDSLGFANNSSNSSHAYPDHPAILGAPVITPAVAYNTTTLTCNPGLFVDIDGDIENVASRTWRWFINDTLVVGETTTTLAGLFNRTDVINCEEFSQATDWLTSNNTTNSSDIIIQATGFNQTFEPLNVTLRNDVNANLSIVTQYNGDTIDVFYQAFSLGPLIGTNNFFSNLSQAYLSSTTTMYVYFYNSSGGTNITSTTLNYSTREAFLGFNVSSGNIITNQTGTFLVTYYTGGGGGGATTSPMALLIQRLLFLIPFLLAIILVAIVIDHARDELVEKFLEKMEAQEMVYLAVLILIVGAILIPVLINIISGTASSSTLILNETFTATAYVPTALANPVTSVFSMSIAKVYTLTNATIINT